VGGPGAPGRPGPRHQARERALALLYEAEIKRRPVTEVVDELPVPPDPYAVTLVRGVAEHRHRIDALLAAATVGWDVARLAAVDRAVLRLATYELLEQLQVPVAVVIDEAVELAGEYSTDDSGRFVNGVLSAVATRLRG
jgi:N utilization substance protein B